MKHTEETKRKISEHHKKFGIKPPNQTGFHHSKKTIAKIRKASRKPENIEKRRLATQRGSEHYAWKGGRLLWWKKEVKKRDNYTCVICGLHDSEVVEADHIKPQYKYPKLAYVLSNGRTLCANCHRRKTNREKERKQKHD